MNILERFLDYVNIPTSSDDNASTVPTTKKQFVLANRLADDMKALGITDAYVDELCYVYGHIPATPGYEKAKAVGFIAHVDTSPDFADAPMNVQIHENYDGGDIALGSSGRVIDNATFAHLPSLKGRTLLTTDGMTLLGADDKAGVAEILDAVQHILENNIPHGKICIGFTPDEECGTSADNFSLDKFGADYAYTVDGGREGEVVYECFNASTAIFEIKGFNIHPGSAKDKMINAALVAMEINSMLPTGETPRDTEGYEGFFHLTDMEGDAESARTQYIVRDHNAANFKAREDTLRHIEKLMNAKYGDGTVTLTIRESYRNMEEMIRPHFYVVEIANEATKMSGLEPTHEPIRGGTDGSRLSYMGLPTPNLGTGGYAFHGPYEHITVEGMKKSSEIIVNIIKISSEK